jgi:threonyl-tRNA synthetase
MPMSAPAHLDLLRVPAGTSAGAAVRDAGLPGRGEAGAIVVVRDADGRLRDLSWTPEAEAEVTP